MTRKNTLAAPLYKHTAPTSQTKRTDPRTTNSLVRRSDRERRCFAQGVLAMSMAVNAAHLAGRVHSDLASSAGGWRALRGVAAA